MNKVPYLLFLLFVVGCSTKESQSDATTKEDVIIVEKDIADLLVSIKDPYRVSFEINESNENENEYDLYVSFELDSGYYFASPLSKGYATEKLHIVIEEHDSLTLDSIFIEKSASITEGNSSELEHVNWVKGNASYKIRLEVTSVGDFEILGLVSFRLQPKKHLQQIEFTISRQSNKIIVLKNGYTASLPTEILHMKTGAYIKGY
jgi:hypothetical protein